MKFTEDLSTSNLNHITGFEKGCVIVQQKIIDSSHIIAPDALVSWELNSFNEVKDHHIDQVVALNPEVIILGTGIKHQLPNKSTLKQLVQCGIGFEIMNTMAASRTYNILIAEGRRAVAGLIIEATAQDTP